eukprot:TRINITY_DN6610_c0_g1_i1.p2 TRINITY_DN6610_c0_g1~~TRINITY_DN6610_c0_g1_i1.p2  ORF type:complete len:309 (+),score=90.57 TRINITY_DN6610_c0_g1_i1:915-1841(+)
MGITTVLVMITLMYTLTSKLPDTMLTTAIDGYFVLCIFVVVANILEFVMVHFVLRSLDRRKKLIAERRKHLSHLLSLVRKGGTGAAGAPAAPTVSPHARDSPGATAAAAVLEGNTEPLQAATPSPSGGVPGAGARAAGDGKAGEDGSQQQSGEQLSPGPGGRADPPSRPTQQPQQTTAAQEAELEEAFKVFHQDDSGAIDVADLRVILESMGALHQEVAQLIDLFNRDQKGKLKFAHFSDLMIQASTVAKEPNFRGTEVSALTCCGKGVTRSTVDRIEGWYRRIIPAGFITLTVIWFIAIGATAPDDG